MASIEIEHFVEDWERLFAAALLECDCDKLQQRIADAELAIMRCAHRLDECRDSSKLKTLMEALITLRELRTVGHT